MTDTPSAMSHTTMQWYEYNINGHGKAEDRCGDYAYYKDVMYHTKQPWRRLIKQVSEPRGWVELYQHPSDVGMGNSKKWGHRWIIVPSIGVLSRWPDDMFSADEMHMRNKYLLLMEAKAMTEESLANVNGRILSNEVHWRNPKNQLIETMGKMYLRWDAYRTAFKLDWPELPARYKEELLAEIQRRIDKYLDPKTAAKRERVKARKQAVKALLG